jgi:hypothetical protein
MGDLLAGYYLLRLHSTFNYLMNIVNQFWMTSVSHFQITNNNMTTGANIAIIKAVMELYPGNCSYVPLGSKIIVGENISNVGRWSKCDTRCHFIFIIVTVGFRNLIDTIDLFVGLRRKVFGFCVFHPLG